jgi:hypothetical protein
MWSATPKFECGRGGMTLQREADGESVNGEAVP